MGILGERNGRVYRSTHIQREGMKRITIDLPENVWRSVDGALQDFLKFGPAELDAEYIPDEHLEKARRAIAKELQASTRSR